MKLETFDVSTSFMQRPRRAQVDDSSSCGHAQKQIFKEIRVE